MLIFQHNDIRKNIKLHLKDLSEGFRKKDIVAEKAHILSLFLA
jgi:hypothetical protein